MSNVKIKCEIVTITKILYGDVYLIDYMTME